MEHVALIKYVIVVVTHNVIDMNSKLSMLLEVIEKSIDVEKFSYKQLDENACKKLGAFGGSRTLPNQTCAGNESCSGNRECVGNETCNGNGSCNRTCNS